MKLLLLLFLSTANIHHYKAATGADTVFSDASGLLQVDTGRLIINGISYAKTYVDTYSSPITGYTYQTYTLDNGWQAVITRFCNNELEAVTVDEGAKVESWYCR